MIFVVCFSVVIVLGVMLWNYVLVERRAFIAFSALSTPRG